MVFRLAVFGLLILGLIAVSVFGVSILEAPKPQAAGAAPTATEQIIVAADAVQGGGLLQPSDITGAPVLVSAAPAGASVDTPANRSAIVGSMVRFPVTAGTPLLSDSVIHPGDHGFLAAVLAPGMRAVTVAVDDVTGANGLIWPGDNVDVLLTENLLSAPLDKSIASEIVLSDVRVIATGAELIKNTTAPSTGPNAPPQAQTVTLEVTPNEAARCLVATNLGRLSLIVHSAQSQKNGVARPPVSGQPVWAGDVSPALANTQPHAAAVSTVKVFQGSPAEQDFNF